MHRLFRELNRELGTAFIIVTHDRSVAQQTDRILEVQDGMLLQDVRSSYAEDGPAEQAEPAEPALEPQPAVAGGPAGSV